MAAPPLAFVKCSVCAQMKILFEYCVQLGVKKIALFRVLHYAVFYTKCHYFSFVIFFYELGETLTIAFVELNCLNINDKYQIKYLN